MSLVTVRIGWLWYFLVNFRSVTDLLSSWLKDYPFIYPFKMAILQGIFSLVHYHGTHYERDWNKLRSDKVFLVMLWFKYTIYRMTPFTEILMAILFFTNFIHILFYILFTFQIFFLIFFILQVLTMRMTEINSRHIEQCSDSSIPCTEWLLPIMFMAIFWWFSCICLFIL